MLSDVLRTIRLAGALQFCFAPTGAWQTDATADLGAAAPDAIPFHIVVEGRCWLKKDGQTTMLAPGDVVALPFASAHQLGAGSAGRLIMPMRDLPPAPWRELPILSYGTDRTRVRLLCGYLRCAALTFRPLRNSLPALLHVRTRGVEQAAWLRATIAQIASEAQRPRAGGLSMLERLTEIVFIELLRHQILAARPETLGWLAALADPALGRCLSLIHDDPRREWSVQDLAEAAGVSRSTLATRFEAVLSISPVRYVREWRLCLASIALSTTGRSITTIAHEAGYGTEAAFNRAFARTYGAPPAAWRLQARRSGGIQR